MPPSNLRGKGGGVPWVQIMENESECLGDRRGHDGHLVNNNNNNNSKLNPPNEEGLRLLS